VGSEEVVRECVLYCIGGVHDKEYRIVMRRVDTWFKVEGHWGRRGAATNSTTKYYGPYQESATNVFDRLYADKWNKGYRPAPDETLESFLDVVVGATLDEAAFEAFAQEQER
jgi:hypothetical protein